MLVSVHLDREPAEDKLPALGKRGLASVHLDRLAPVWDRLALVSIRSDKPLVEKMLLVWGKRGSRRPKPRRSEMR